MANIREYESPIEGFRPDSLGPEALNQAGNHAASAAYRIQNFADRAGAKIGGGIQALGDGVQTYENENIGRSELGMAAPLAATTKELLQRKVFDIYNSADPNDISVHDKAIEATNELIQNSGAGFKSDVGQKHWMGEQSDLYKYGSALVAGLDGTRAFTATQNNFKTTLNSYAATIDNDPSELNLQTSIDALARNGKAAVAGNRFLSGEGGEKAIQLYTSDGKDALVQHFMVGQATKNPDFQKKWDAGDYDKWKSSVTPVEQDDLQKLAAQADKARVETQKAQVEMQTKAATAKVEQLSTTALTDNLKFDPDTGKLTVDPKFNQSILDIGKVMGPGSDGQPVPIAKVTELRTMFELGKAVREDSQKGITVATDPHTYEDFRERAFLPPDDPNHLTNADVAQARVDRKLSDKDWTMFNHAVNVTSKNPQQVANEKQFNGFFNSIKGFVAKGNAFAPADPRSEQRAFEMRQYLEDQYAAGIATGKAPRALLTYGGPDGIANDQVIKRYQPSNAELLPGAGGTKVTDPTSPLPNPNVGGAPKVPAASAWKAGESMDDYFKRITGGAAKQ